MGYQIIDPTIVDLLLKKTSIRSTDLKASHPLRTRLQETIDASDLTSTQWVALLLIADTNAKHPIQLSSLMQISPSSVTNMVDQLLKLNLITRTREICDRRKVALQLTETGRLLVRKLTDIRDTALIEIN